MNYLSEFERNIDIVLMFSAKILFLSWWEKAVKIGGDQKGITNKQKQEPMWKTML